MEYTEEILNRETGELEVISKGDWITITELGALYGVGPRQVREVLREMDFLQIEGVRIHQRHRLAKWVSDRGWGKRLTRTIGKAHTPFDVVGPEAREWIAERWEETRAKIDAQRNERTTVAASELEDFRKDRNLDRHLSGRNDMTVRDMVYWLEDHHPKLTQVEISLILSVSQPLISRFLKERKTASVGRRSNSGFIAIQAQP